MSMPAFDSLSLKQRLEKLDSKRQLAFGVLCCERLLPNYLAFERDSGWGDFAQVRKALNGIWAFLDDQALSPQEIKSLTTSCESVAPDSGKFDSIYLTSAQDACFAVCALLDYLLESDAEKIVQAAAYATDSVDLYAQEIESMDPNDPQLERKILMHRLMQRELIQQNEDLKAIESVSALSSEFLNQCKVSWNNGGKGNLEFGGQNT